MRLIAREALLMRRAGRSLVFAAAAAWVAWAAWPGPAGNVATAVARVYVVTVLVVLAGLPLLVRWLFGPADGRPEVRVLRAATYAAVLVLTVAKASVEQVVNAPPAVAFQAAHGGLQPLAFTWFAETIFLLIVAGYVAAILVMTARRPRVAPATLAIGTGAGIVLGVVMCGDAARAREGRHRAVAGGVSNRSGRSACVDPAAGRAAGRRRHGRMALPRTGQPEGNR